MPDAPTKLPVTTDKSAPATAGGWAPFDTLRREIDTLFDSFRLGAPWRTTRSPFESALSLSREDGWLLSPAVDAAEKEASYEITAELPGLDEKDIEVKLSNGMLTIRGEKREQKEEKQKDYLVSERRYGSFTRSFQVPDGVDADRIAAHFSKGVLTVSLPKSAEARKNEKKIEVKAA